MDTFRSSGNNYEGYFEGADEHFLDEPYDTPPPAIGNNERRMQVRAYNFWASQLGDGHLPNIASLDPTNVADFGVNAVLLDFSDGSDDPRVTFLGAALAEECEVGTRDIRRLSDVPSRSLLSRITDHYMQIIANQAPIGFEAEFVNQRGSSILYRGILLPYTGDNQTITHIYGVINWKELADQAMADELLLEIEQAIEPALRQRSEHSPLGDWADGPGAAGAHAEVHDHAQAMGLADWLARAREQAAQACEREDRTRSALYDAVSRAWDFALAAAAAPEEFAEMLDDAGMTVQKRAPMTPIVKLVFGAGYDKTRITEYAAVLAHARRNRMPRGSLAAFLREAEGGLKGVVAIERRLRREDAGKPDHAPRSAPRKVIARRLREIAPRSLAALAPEGEEFALVMVRRSGDGSVSMLGEVPNDVALVEKAARRLLA
ncbi:hypothetical protein D2V17_10625 [Aurantiacibacter xanthus]|uniref:PAS domain-containing protein n=1 Tax=Aurantiacibacter xanthus TaxID=1784712 RepID=A0A3A1P7E6_9SPHN|nr:hypothetical protein [Aurantiacibacter xanthus]RIV85407.1 hypothetical protein D2V17_10625 [Aurantiacibacter xanthus]